MPSFDLRAAAREAMVEHGLRVDFPEDVQHEVAQLPDAPPSVGAPLPDLRGTLWSSIDNRESRDLDQLEWAEERGDGGIRLLVAVADVDSRVPRGSATDAHAGFNTASVYTGVAVFPMLPDRLCTDLTSLNPAEDRRALVVDLTLDAHGSVEAQSVYTALVKSHAKLDYESVGAWLMDEGPLPPSVAEIPGLEPQLRLQDTAAQRLLRARRHTGVLDLDTIEARPLVVDGRVVDMQTVKRNRARDLIENLMVAANTALARHLRDREVASIRRVVRTPARWARIVELAAQLGETLPPEPASAPLAAFLAKRRLADPEHHADLSLSVVKLLGPGEYVVEKRQGARREQGHFALGAAEYAHGTAPNRRYADLVTQRLVKARDAAPYNDDELRAIALRCTTQEDIARKVERTLRKKAAALLMRDRVGQRFSAIVTGASPKGTYVRLLSPPVEGRVVRGLDGLDVGDTVKVTLLSADPKSGFIDFAGPGGDVTRKLHRSREKKVMASRLLGRVGESFDAIVTAATPKGTWVELSGEKVSGRVVRGARGLVAGQPVRVKLVSLDTVHGFIDFERPEGIAAHQALRRERKRAAAVALRDRVGQAFDAVVTSRKDGAVYVRTVAPVAEGRLVRGGDGVAVGAPVRIRLVSVDVRRAYIDFVPA